MTNELVKKIFNQNGNVFTVIEEPSFNFHETLPPGTYSVCVSMSGYYLERRDDFKIDHKIYGSAKNKAERILNTYSDRSMNTGVILQGEKGSGKTLLAKILAEEFVKEGGITLLINQKLYGQAFNDLLFDIKQPTLVIFDEFEKIYSVDDQNHLLSVFDGLFPSKKLFVVAINETNKLNSFFKNRPGRFMYQYTYAGLEEDFIREYCEENLKNKKNIDSVVVFSASFHNFNFDMLKHLVEDMNRYNETAGEVLKHLNIESSGHPMHLIIDKILNSENQNVEIPKSLKNRGLMMNPFSDFRIDFNIYDEDEEEDDDSNLNKIGVVKTSKKLAEFKISPSKDLVSVENGVFTYRNSEGTFVLHKNVKQPNSFSWG